MSEWTELRTVQIGGLAKEILAVGASGKVAGVTSSGFFLNTADRILFLTSADYRSPYNIQVAGLSRLSSILEAGDVWQSTDEFLIFTRVKIRIDTTLASVWQPSLITQIETTATVQQDRMSLIIRRLHEMDPSKGWIFLADCKNPSIAEGNPEAARICQLTEWFLECAKNEDLIGCLESCRSIMGLGGGLTPSGDDWLTGFFLYYSRCAQAGKPQSSFLLELGEAVTTMAFERTTKISANRIEAASRGWAEELFLQVVDSLLTAEGHLSDEQLLHLVRFGHSSGVDTCVGIMAAVRVVASGF